MINSESIRRIHKFNLCKICSNEIENFSTITVNSLTKDMVCKHCPDKFEASDIEFMVRMFTAFGGYFEQFKLETERRDKYLEKFRKTRKKSISKVGATEISLLHQCLLHGIHPKDLKN